MTIEFVLAGLLLLKLDRRIGKEDRQCPRQLVCKKIEIKLGIPRKR